MTEVYENIYDILDEVQGHDQAYKYKMIHEIPKSSVVDRVQFILTKCKDKVVLDVGCAANVLHQKIEEVAKVAYGIDKEKVNYNHFFRVNLDQLHNKQKLPDLDVDLVLCGELLEHLSNPGIFLSKLKKYKAPILITVPNAHCETGYLHVAQKATENVNRDHVAYYSWRTMKTLIERYGYEIQEFYWYNGRERISEGLIFIVE